MYKPAKGIIELNNKTTTRIIDNNSQIENNVPAISFKKDTNIRISDKKYDNINDTSFIDKMISETTDPELIAHLEKQKRNCVFYY